MRGRREQSRRSSEFYPNIEDAMTGPACYLDLLSPIDVIEESP
jgi:hypothetical protein